MLSNVDEIKSKLDIVDVVQEFFPLKQAGANFKANCPFHNEKSPSFMVSREKQIFHCFGCNEGGDMFTFIQKIEGVEFPEALRILAKKAGVQLQYQDPGTTNLKTRLQDVNREATDWFRAKLRENIGGVALNYLLNTRKMTEDTIGEFGIGYAPESWDGLSKYLKSKNFLDNEIKQSGLVVEKPNGGFYDRFRNRLMIPITDHHGVTVGFTGRTMSQDESAKYVNTPQTLIFNKSALLFGLDKAKQEIRQKGQVILVEGQMDAIACYQAGTKNVVAVSGTALTQDHLQILKRYTENLAFCLDADSAGQVATTRGFGLAWSDGLNIKIISLPEGYKDPDELIRADVARWRKTVEQAKRAMDYFFDKALNGLDLNNIDSKKRAASSLLGLVKNLQNRIDQDHYIKLLASNLGTDEKFLREAIHRVDNKRQPNRAVVEGVDNVPRPSKIKVLSERILALMQADDTYIKKIANELPVEAVDNSCQELYKELIIYYTNKDSNLDEDGKLSSNLLREYLLKRKPDLIGLFDVIGLLAKDEWEYKDEVTVREGMRQTVKELKRDYLSKKQKINQIEITRLDNLKDKSQIQESRLQELMREHAKLAEEVRILN